MATYEREQRLIATLNRRQPTLTVVCEHIADPHNVFAIMRTMDAVGAGTLHVITEQPELFEGERGHKSSSTAKQWIELFTYTSIGECYNALHAHGYSIYASVIADGSLSLFDVDFTKASALVFGNEHEGVSREAMEKADYHFHIPQVGMVQSLNVSVATGISLYEAYRQRGKAGMYDAQQLSEAEYRRLLNAWKR